MATWQSIMQGGGMEISSTAPLMTYTQVGQRPAYHMLQNAQYLVLDLHSMLPC